MGLWEAQEAFLGQSAGRYDKQAASLGVEKDGEKIPFFQCDDGKFYIPEIKSRYAREACKIHYWKNGWAFLG